MSRSVDLEAENKKLRSACQTLGKVVTRLTESMEAARIEMIQNGPGEAMEWILNALPDVDDNEPEDQWDGLETACQWLDRTRRNDAEQATRENTTKETPNA